MAKWKELGEVPDSDDESAFDSQESQQDLPLQNVPREQDELVAKCPAPDRQDVWDIPPSSQDSASKYGTTSRPTEAVPQPPPESNASTPIPHPSPTPPPIFDIDDSPERSSQPVEGNEGELAEVEEPEPAIQSSTSADFVETVLEIQGIPDENIETSREEAIRLGRSLRPRKPIQEHPYLLESAQYSKTLKSHGVRPLRVQLEEAARRRQEEEESQEQDYEEDSQLTSKNTAQEDSEESQARMHLDSFDDVHGLANSSAGSPSPSPSPQRDRAQLETSLRSSQDDEEEFPDVNDIDKWKPKKRTGPVSKRRASPKVSSKRKVPRLDELVRFAREVSPPPATEGLFDIPPSPPRTSPALLAVTPSTAIGHSRPVTTLTPKPSSTISSRSHSPAPANQSARIVDLTGLEDEDNTFPEQGSSSGSGSESESDVVRATRKRMRGVLPASWLRLDQQGIGQKKKKTIRQQSLEPSPNRSHRKGVAQRRQISPKPGNLSSLFLDDSGDDDIDIPLADFIESPNDDTAPIFEDDAGSVVEEDHIDRMLPGRKRANANANDLDRPRKRRKDQRSTFTGHPGRRRRQQKITGHLDRTKSVTADSSTQSHRPKSNIAVGRRTNNHAKTPTGSRLPPRLSILDVVEPDAPSFIRIAARAAKRRPDQGRSSPSRKHITLGTRKDNIDAAEVLRSWKRGSIQPRISLSTISAARPPTALPQPLQPVSHNSVSQIPTDRTVTRVRRVVPSTRFSQPRRMVKQISMNNFVNVETERPSTPIESTFNTPSAKRFPIGQEKTQNAFSRPAQLEAAGEKVGQHAFHSRKRALDALYRKSRKALPVPSNVRLERFVGSQVSIERPQQQIATVPSGERPEIIPAASVQRRTRFRKRFQPRSVDITAPQYAHANDPLPLEQNSSISSAEVVDVSEGSGKLLGLGPFGTHYTHHFDIFPLDPGTFFHQSTLLGQGRLMKTVNEKSLDHIGSPRGRRTFGLDEKTLQWGQWDAQISSELGIVFDWIAEDLSSNAPDLEPNPRTTAVQAIDFVLDYLQDYISLPDQEAQKLFTDRVLEVLQNFSQRLEALPTHSHSRARPLIDVLTRSLIVTLHVLRICQKLGELSGAFRLEELLKTMAKNTARRLLGTDLEDIRALYNDLQQMSFRERGIRDDKYSAICWVTLIRVLEEARIPRSGFWDVVSSAMLGTDSSSIIDAQIFERIWRDLFTLLPLGEFDNSGVVLTGIRQTIPLEGWSIPQSLMRRVFQLYQSNSRQSPSFNDYCRGIVSRCHFLVEQWGWRKGNTIVGTIFDFFAAQGLSHLRNEEVYRSPEFLEHLAGSPSLTIVPEDRCFHIFLKLLALAIKRLRKFGFIKDVRNLVARVLPNHDRQHDKEKDIHETELAALRNHHDLLCTLFWAAPVDLRPSVQIIEKLVVPGSSHKEACLISLRAWSQLSRFVVSSSNDVSAYKPFADWQKNIFQQVLEQYLSVESDIQQQFLRMSKDASRSVSQDMMNAIIRMNKKGAMDVLHFSMKAFLDVMRHSPTLGAASFALNHYQLDQALTRFSVASADFDWSTLRASLDILDHYLDRIEAFPRQEHVHADHSWHEEDAIMLLERKLAVPFFSMTRTIVVMDFKDIALGPTSDRSLCAEQAVSLAGRVAARLFHARLCRLSHFFKSGKFHVFPDLPKTISWAPRKYLSLFEATLIDQGVVDFKDIGVTPLELFLGELVKPFKFLAYENRLAAAMKRHGDPYLKDAIIEMGNNPDYNSNRDLFGHTVAAMRKALRGIDTGRRQQLQTEFSQTLRSTMDRMKLDLKSITLDSPEHANHIEFVRSIIVLIRSQDLCAVDSYFYQISREYSPSSQDPRLQTAGILSWGLKLEEGDTKAVSGLFYLLFPNFKLALANGKLPGERSILEQSMRNPYVFSFMLGKMFPAIVKAATQAPEGWVLLDTYLGAFDALFTEACIHREIGGDNVVDLVTLFECTSAGVRQIQALHIDELRPEHIVTLTLMTSLLNLVCPSATAYMINEPSFHTSNGIMQTIDTFTSFTRLAGEYLSELLDENGADRALTVDPVRLFGGLEELHGEATLQQDKEIVNRFANHMVQDIKNNWVSNESTITVKGPSRPQGPSATQSGQGTPMPGWKAKELVRSLNEQIQTWNDGNDRTAARRRNRMPFDDYLL